MRDRATTASLHPAGTANDFLYGAGASIALRFLVADHEHTCADMLHGGGQGSPKVGPQGDQRSSTSMAALVPNAATSGAVAHAPTTAAISSVAIVGSQGEVIATSGGSSLIGGEPCRGAGGLG